MSEEKDFWDKVDILLRPVGGIIAAITVATIGYFGSDYLKKMEQLNTNSRVFAQIVSQREGADSSLRINMFNSIITKFLNNPADRGEQILSLELLAYNFHESLDLAPLFKHMDKVLGKDIETLPEALAVKERTNAVAVISENKARLERVAKEVSAKQVTALSETGFNAQGTVFFDELEESPQGITVIDKQKLGDRWFKLEVLKHFPLPKELRIKLTVYTRVTRGGENTGGWSISDATFTMGFFDFPMIDNTRLSDGKRAAVILREWDRNRSAEVQVVYFPGSRASLKEKQYYDELLKDLLKFDERRKPATPVQTEGER